jgi:putative oxidoreductase
MRMPATVLSPTTPKFALARAYEQVAGALTSVPWSVVVIPMRLAAFSVFWRSGSVKLDDWDSTISLFQDEYKVPVLPPEIAAYLATAMELGCSTLILIGLGTRFAALGLIGMIAVIQTFVYPAAWPDHIQWFAFLFPLMMRGGGRFSLDRVVGRLAGVR